jgi:SOS-response transcriptional repressor LexA
VSYLRGALVLNPLDLAEQLGLDGFAAANALRDVVNVRPGNANLSGDSGEGALRREKLSELLLPRAIVTRNVVTFHKPLLYVAFKSRSRTKMRATGVSLSRPEWASKISDLRKVLGHNQAAFGKAIGVSQVAVSRWEAATDKPSALNFLRMAQLAKDNAASELHRFFYNLSNIDTVLADKEGRPLVEMPGHYVAPEVRLEMQAGRGSKNSSGGLKRKPDVVAVPLLKDGAAAGSPRLIDEAAVEDIILIRRKECPHPDDTVCVRVQGDSMSPVLEEGYIVAIDTADRDPKKLVAQMVAARDPEGGVTIKWLRRVGEEMMLIAQHTSPRYNPIFLDRERGWIIIGRVLFWIGKSPAR